MTMMTIWKYTLPAFQWSAYVDMPVGARILSVGLQDRKVVVWALVDKQARVAERRLWLVPTGSPGLEDFQGRAFVGTVQIPPLPRELGGPLGGEFVVHVFTDPDVPEVTA